jgi:hypothetical protein
MECAGSPRELGARAKINSEMWLLGWSVKRESVERDKCSDALTLYPATAGLHALDAGRRQFVRITPKAPKLFLHGH